MGISVVNIGTDCSAYEVGKKVKGIAKGEFENHIMQANKKCTSFTLHSGTAEDGRMLGSIAGGGESGMAVFKPEDFDPQNPVYKVKIWDAEGKVTERLVDVTNVDVQNCDSADMYAYSCYLTDSGQYKAAQDTFCRMEGFAAKRAQGGDFDRTVFNKISWIGIAKSLMQMQYKAGNLQGYLEYKKFADFCG